jgi:hypothetical protein
MDPIIYMLEFMQLSIIQEYKIKFIYTNYQNLHTHSSFWQFVFGEGELEISNKLTTTI